MTHTATLVIPTIFLGYAVEKIGAEWLLLGPRGGVSFSLHLCLNSENVYYATGKTGNRTHVKGNYLFTDANGTLETVN